MADILPNPVQRRRRVEDGPPPSIVVNGKEITDPASYGCKGQDFVPSSPLEILFGNKSGIHFAGVREIIDPLADKHVSNDPVINLLNDIAVGYVHGTDLSDLSGDIQKIISNLDIRSALMTAVNHVVAMQRMQKFQTVRSTVEDWLCKAAVRKDMSTQEALDMLTYVNSQADKIEKQIAAGPPPAASFQNPEHALEQSNYAEISRQRSTDDDAPPIGPQEMELINKLISERRKQMRDAMIDVEATTVEPTPAKKTAKKVAEKRASKKTAKKAAS